MPTRVTLVVTMRYGELVSSDYPADMRNLRAWQDLRQTRVFFDSGLPSALSVGPEDQRSSHSGSWSWARSEAPDTLNGNLLLDRGRMLVPGVLDGKCTMTLNRRDVLGIGMLAGWSSGVVGAVEAAVGACRWRRQRRCFGARSVALDRCQELRRRQSRQPQALHAQGRGVDERPSDAADLAAGDRR